MTDLTQIFNNSSTFQNVTTVNTATYDLLTGDQILNVTYTSTGAVTSLTLPTAQVVAGRTIIINDADGNAKTNHITIDTEGAELIDGGATHVMATNYECILLFSDGTNWYTIANYQLSPSFKSYNYSARTTAVGTYYLAGFYNNPATDSNLNQGSLTQAWGSADNPYASHAFIVAGGVGTTDGSDLVLTVTGTSINDAGTRTPTDSEVIVADCVGASTDQYYATSKKWIGTVTFTLSSTGGATFNFDFNYGLCKYEDWGNRRFILTDFECVGLCNATDGSFDIILYKHSSTGWTYSAGAFIAGGTIIAQMTTVHSTESELDGGEEFAFKRSSLMDIINGELSEGLVISVTTGVNNSISFLNAHVGVIH